MQAVKSKDTKPEMIVRRLLFRKGYRYRLHCKSLPGNPDIVFTGRRKVIFVNGCFWHRHDCKFGRIPKSRLDYWRPKLEQNAKRDRLKSKQLESLGWRILVIWQCETADLDTLAATLRKFLDESKIPIDTNP